MKNLVLGFGAILPLIFIASSAFGNTGGMSDGAIKSLAYFFAVAIASFGGTAAQSAAASTALEGMARNPSAADKLFVPMILGLALIESLVIFVLITVFLV